MIYTVLITLITILLTSFSTAVHAQTRVTTVYPSADGRYNNMTVTTNLTSSGNNVLGTANANPATTTTIHGNTSLGTANSNNTSTVNGTLVVNGASMLNGNTTIGTATGSNSILGNTTFNGNILASTVYAWKLVLMDSTKITDPSYMCADITNGSSATYADSEGYIRNCTGKRYVHWKSVDYYGGGGALLYQSPGRKIGINLDNPSAALHIGCTTLNCPNDEVSLQAEGIVKLANQTFTFNMLTGLTTKKPIRGAIILPQGNPSSERGLPLEDGMIWWE